MRGGSVHYRLTLVMPVYNEEDCLDRVVRGWLDVLRDDIGPYRLIVVDDGSKDGSGEILDKLAAELPAVHVIHQPNSGHGAALRAAYRAAADSDWVFQVDSDDQFLPREFSFLWDMRHDADFIIGYRTARRDGPVRLLVTRTLRLILWALFSCRLRDANIPFRLMRGGTLAELLAYVPEGAFIPNVLLSVLACKRGRFVQDVPVTHLERKTGKVSIANIRLLRALVRCTIELLSFRLGPFRSISGAAAPEVVNK